MPLKGDSKSKTKLFEVPIFKLAFILFGILKNS